MPVPTLRDAADQLRRRLAGARGTPVERYWSRHLVRERPFTDADESANYLEWRFEEYPLFREFADLWGKHDDQIVLDYGCGPGNDVTGFLLHTSARKIVGVDISEKALRLARKRVALHDPEPDRVELIRASDVIPAIPLDTDSVDYFQCMGVLQHTSEPEAILGELRRVLRAGGEGRVMVYNRDSVWLHLYAAYVKMVLEGRYAGLSIEDAFQRTTDGEDCPIARCYRPSDFISICRAASFDAEFVGGYLSRHELQCLDQYGEAALADERLDTEHREFVRGLTRDDRGYPLHTGMHAGVGGTYLLRS